MRDLALIVALANARAVRRPTGARAPELHDALADAASATELLAAFAGRAVTPRELEAVRELQQAVVVVVDALIDGSAPPLGRLNTLAANHPAALVLEQAPSGALHVALRPRRASAAAILTHQVFDELDAVEPRRLRRCSRPECRLVFYDVTRSATRRWHSERPCGLRERQRRHRAKRATESPDPITVSPGATEAFATAPRRPSSSEATGESWSPGSSLLPSTR